MSLPQIGIMAPVFTVLNQYDERISLKDFRGRSNVLLYFYPKALTPGCTVQACGMRDSALALEKLDTVVLGISPDPVPKLLRFSEKHGLNFDLLSDPEHLVANEYGVWGQKKMAGREYMGLIRTTFIIGKDGRLKEVLNKFQTKKHTENVLASLEGLPFSE